MLPRHAASARPARPRPTHENQRPHAERTEEDGRRQEGRQGPAVGKSEIPNSKHETNPNTKIRKSVLKRLDHSESRTFEFVSDFGFRASAFQHRLMFDL